MKWERFGEFTDLGDNARACGVCWAAVIVEALFQLVNLWNVTSHHIQNGVFPIS